MYEDGSLISGPEGGAAVGAGVAFLKNEIPPPPAFALLESRI